ncbi:MAG TPA: GTP-binding protein [Usitatibacter sp.]|nr:GTP-binding protein [Usitatibacter sp.]
MSATPVVVLAGALGAGKTSLLGRCLAEPAFGRVAVIVDELGELEVDPHLLPASPVAVKRAPCGRWTEALEALAQDAGETGFERVIVEANGVATPASVVAALEEHDSLRERFALEGIVAAVDAAHGAEALETDPLCRAQAAGADALVLTRLDLADGARVNALVAALMRLNPYAEILRPAASAFDPRAMCEAAARAPGREVRRLQGLVDAASMPQVGSLCVRFAHAIELSGFCVRLAAFLEQHAAQLLRVKGLVRVEGRRGPAVIQAVGATLYPVRTLRQWPAGVHESALVVVARGMPDDELRVGVESAGAARRRRKHQDDAGEKRP